MSAEATMRNALLLVLLLPATTAAQATVVNFHARVLGPEDTPVEGSLSVRFRLYKFQNPTDNEPTLHEETHTLTAVKGVLSADLGKSGFPANLFAEEQLWLGIKVGEEGESVPRLRLARVPWATHAANASEAAHAAEADHADDADRALAADSADLATDVDCDHCVGAGDIDPAALPDTDPQSFATGSIPLEKIDAFAGGAVDADTLLGHATGTAEGAIPLLGSGGRLPSSMLPLGIDAATVGGLAPASGAPSGATLAWLDAVGKLALASLPDVGLSYRIIHEGTATPGQEITIDHTAFPSERLQVSVWFKDGTTWQLAHQGTVGGGDPIFGNGQDGDVTLSTAGPHVLQSLVPGYDGVNRVLNVRNLTLTNGAVITAAAWNGTTGGRVIIRALGTVSICPTCRIHADFIGYRGGAIVPVNSSIAGIAGEGPGGGGGAPAGNSCGHGGGGGGGSYGTAGEDGTPDLCRCTSFYGQKGATYGDAALTGLPLGSGGASGSEGHNSTSNAEEPGRGGNGGGAVAIYAQTITNQGTISANGEKGEPKNGWSTSNPQVGSGAAGSGGSILLYAKSLTPGTVSAVGGPRGVQQGWTQCGSTNTDNGQRGGAGGKGRIRFEYETIGAATADPVASSQPTTIPTPAGSLSYTAKITDANTLKVRTYASENKDVRVVVTAFK
jgi:hypothetical protein